MFEKAIGRDMEKVSSSVEECIKQAQIKESDIQLVILTGGSTGDSICPGQVIHIFLMP